MKINLFLLFRSIILYFLQKLYLMINKMNNKYFYFMHFIFYYRHKINLFNLLLLTRNYKMIIKYFLQFYSVLYIKSSKFNFFHCHNSLKGVLGYFELYSYVAKIGARNCRTTNLLHFCLLNMYRITLKNQKFA